MVGVNTLLTHATLRHWHLWERHGAGPRTYRTPRQATGQGSRLRGRPLVFSCHCLIPHYERRMECVTPQRSATASLSSSSSSFTSSLIHLGSAHETFWYQLGGTQRNRGPIDTSAFNPLFCSGKAGRGRKFKHEDSVQIAVTLAREEGESRLGEEKWITVPSTTGANPAFLSIKFPFMLFIKKITKGKLSHTGRVTGWSVYSLDRCLSNNKSIETNLSTAGSLKFQLWNRACLTGKRPIRRFSVGIGISICFHLRWEKKVRRHCTELLWKPTGEDKEGRNCQQWLLLKKLGSVHWKYNPDFKINLQTKRILLII